MLARKRFVQLVILLGIAALGVGVGYSKNQSVKSGQWSVSLIKQVKCSDPECIGGRAFEFKITKVSSGQSKTLILKNQTREVASLSIFGQKLIVQGKLPYAGDIANIVDMSQGAVIDTIFGYDMHASPDKRHLLYRLWYPRMSMLESRKTIVFLYDVNSSPKANRINKGVGALGPSYIGIPVFPEVNWPGNSFSDYPAVPSFSIHPSPKWFAGSQKVLFTAVDQADYRNLVIVDLKGGLSQLETCTAPLMPKRYGGDGKKASTMIRYIVQSIDITGGEATIQFYERQGIKHTTNVNIGVACFPR